jgi:meiotically up-regulated gene 157 (Mug157) protein
MPNVITVTLSPENRSALENLSRREQIDDIINRAISDYLFIHQFRELRARMIKGIENFGIRSDDDVFNLAS